MSTLHIQLLGEFRLTAGEFPITTLSQLRQQALLAYLLLHHNAPQFRQQIAFCFWPDTSESQSHTNLRQLLHHLRRAWPELDQYVEVGAKTLHWRRSADIKLDITIFNQAFSQATTAMAATDWDLARSAFAQAVETYQGDLLPGCYEDWLLAEREQLRQHYLDALGQLLILFENAREYGAAIQHAQRLLRVDPLHETTYRRLMRLHALNGDRASALRTYHLCATTLAQELGVEPSPETQAAHLRLLNLEVPAVLRPMQNVHLPAREALVGRQGAWSKLMGVWNSTTHGHTHFVCIRGEAGIGKTRLGEELLHWTAQQGIAQARTRCYAAEGSLAYAPVIDWLRNALAQASSKQLSDLWLSEVARLLPELLEDRPTLPHPEPLTERWQRQRFFEAMARTVLNAGSPLLLVIDDLQWCDPETLEWLSYLLHYDTKASLLLLGTLRPEEVTAQHPLAVLFHHLHTTNQLVEIDLDRLTPEETTTLIDQLMSQPIDTATAQRLFHETEGNPLFIVETIRAGLNRSEESETKRQYGNGKHPSLSPSLPLSPAALPPTIYHVIQQRLSQLSPLARELAALAATIGRSFAFDLLAQASHQPEDDVVRGLDELWQRRIIREQGVNSYDFSHDRIREVAYGEVSPIRKPLLHRHIAQALEVLSRENLDEVCGQLAAHYEHAGLLAQAVTHYLQAGKVAHQLLAYPEMEAHLRKGLTVLDQLPETTENLQQKLDTLSHLGNVLMISKGFTAPEVEEVLSRARTLCYSVGDTHTRFEVLRALRTYWLKHCEWEVSSEINTELLALAQQSQHPAYLQAVLRDQGAMAAHRGRLQEAYNYYERAIDIFESNQRLSEVNDYEQDQGISNLRFSMGALWLLGYPDQAQARMNEMLIRSRSVASPFGMLISIDFAMDLEHRLHRRAIVKELAAEYRALNAIHQFPYCVSYEMVFTGWSLCEQGEVDQGMALLNQGVARLHEMEVFLFWPQVATLQVDAHRLTKRYAEGIALIDQTLVFVTKTGESYWNAELHRCKGEFLLEIAGDPIAIEACFQQALAISRQQSAKALELRAATSLARLWQIQDKQAEAHALLTKVYGWFTEGFDTADLQAAKALLNSLQP